ncbi:MAG: family 1 encapsulin nanocompartment shell protein [Methanolobus sp.]|jgi:uncharacterized linocin/CFP29 family protein|nr:family 1 encapsulin nanocompartment shell protein [Methanolobus sp.]
MTNALATFSKEIDSSLVPALRNALIGRKLVHVTSEKGFGITSVDWGRITDVSDGYVSYGFRDGNEDKIEVSLTNSKIPVYWKDYTVDRRIYESWLRSGVDVDKASSISAAYKAAKAENAAIMMGVSNDGTNYDMNGLYQGAGNDYAVSKDFGNYGNATDALAGVYELMDDDGIPVDSLSFNWVLATTQRRQLMASRSANGIKEMPDILDMLNGGQVFGTNTLTTGTGFVCPTENVGEPYVDFYMTSDFKTEHGVDSKHPDTGDLNGRVYSAGILRIKQDVAICKTSAI